jgi:DNA topoisomerase-2
MDEYPGLRQVDKLLNERDIKENELTELLKLTPQDLWDADLDNFLAEWEVGIHVSSLTAGVPRGRHARCEGLETKDESCNQGCCEIKEQSQRGRI